MSSPISRVEANRNSRAREFVCDVLESVGIGLEDRGIKCRLSHEDRGWRLDDGTRGVRISEDDDGVINQLGCADITTQQALDMYIGKHWWIFASEILPYLVIKTRGGFNTEAMHIPTVLKGLDRVLFDKIALAIGVEF